MHTTLVLIQPICEAQRKWFRLFYMLTMYPSAVVTLLVILSNSCNLESVTVTLVRSQMF
jgi:hypothetical protein